MSNIGIPVAGWGLVYLARCAVNGEKPEREKLDRLDLEQVRTLANGHSMVVLGAQALEGCISQEEFLPWKQDRDREIRRTLLLCVEGQRICAAMEQMGIWHMPLKGVIMKNLYPRTDMRQMTDQDILFDSFRRLEMREFMLARGYEPVGKDDSHHDIYHKAPVYNIELHHNLFEDHATPELASYYDNVKHRMIPDSPGGFGYHFSDEDFYLYMVAHAYKHYIDHGVGLRSLLDTYIYCREKTALDWDYIFAQAEELGMADYERESRVLAQKIFGSERQTLTKTEQEMLYFYCYSGAYGTEKAFIDRALGYADRNGATKLKYLFRRVFPSLHTMQLKVKWLRKYPWLLPVAWVQRWFRGVFVKGRHTVKELKYVLHSQQESEE